MREDLHDNPVSFDRRECVNAAYSHARTHTHTHTHTHIHTHTHARTWQVDGNRDIDAIYAELQQFYTDKGFAAAAAMAVAE